MIEVSIELSIVHKKTMHIHNDMVQRKCASKNVHEISELRFAWEECVFSMTVQQTGCRGVSIEENS